MSIYTITSEKAMPYVYMGIHRITGEFYIGSRRTKKIIVSHLDLRKYKTSSKRVKHRFDEFDWFIIAEFFNGEDAYDFEQEMIHDTYKSALSLNLSCYYGKSRFYIKGPRTKAHCDNISKALKGREMTDCQRRALATANLGKKASAETRKKLSESHKGVLHTEEAKLKMSVSSKGKSKSDSHKENIRIARAKQIMPKQPLVICPHCGKQGGAGTMPRWHFDRCPHKPNS